MERELFQTKGFRWFHAVFLTPEQKRQIARERHRIAQHRDIVMTDFNEFGFALVVYAFHYASVITASLVLEKLVL